MKKILFVFCVISTTMMAVYEAAAYPVPTNDISAHIQETMTNIAQVNEYKSEVDSTQNLFKESVYKGIPGYISCIVSGDFGSLYKSMANDGFNLFEAELQKKIQAKEAALKEAQKEAQEKLKKQQEGTEAAEKAVDENRAIAAENKRVNILKKAFTWSKQGVSAAGTLLNSDDKGAAISQITNDVLGDAQVSSAMGKAIDTLKKKKNDDGSNSN